MVRQMKDSGIKWIGEIPEGWRTCKIKDIFQVVSGATPKSEQPEYWDGDIVWVTPADYKTNDKFVSSGKRTLTQAGYDSCGTTLAPAGSIVFSKRAPIGSVAIAQVPLCTNQGCLSCINRSDADTTFFYYVMSIFTEIFELYGSGTTFKELSFDNFASFAMPNPDSSEQQRIAAFLDRKCAEIDAVIERTKATIEEYKKLKQAVITEAVTKGVRGPRPMKDSGIEWIGKIPEEWEVCRKLSYRCKSGISYGIVKLFDPDDENGVKVLRCSDVYPGGVSLENVRTVTQEVSNEYRRTILKGGEVIIAVRGSLGGCAVVTPELVGYNVAREVAVIPLDDDVYNKYVMYYLLSEPFMDYRDSHLLGSVYVGLNIELLSACPIIEPVYSEQIEIVECLDRQCAALDTLIAKKTALLTELETYKKSLIYEYVTGKKECPEAVEQAAAAVEYPYFPAAVSTKKLRFAQAMMMAKVLDMHGKGMGRVKLEKMLYTIETSIGFDFDTEYVREAAGPLHESIYKCEGIISRQNHWYQLHQSQYGVSYTPTKDAGKYRAYYDKYFSAYNAEIERIIDIFKPYSTDQAEIVATLFAACKALQEAMTDAVDVLTTIMKEADTSPATRISAARSVLDYGVKLTELTDLAARVTALEAAAKEAGR